MKRKKLIILFISIMVIGTTAAPVHANGYGMFDKYAYEMCYYTIHYYQYRRVNDCQTGALKRYEYLGERNVGVQESRAYCTTGWGWCQTDEPGCSSDQYQSDVVEVTCE